MEVVLAILGVGLVGGAIMGLVNIGMPSRVRKLQKQVEMLANRLTALERSIGRAETERPVELSPPSIAAATETAVPAGYTLGSPAAADTAASVSPFVNEPPKRSAAWRRLERSFARYWTGILGALALVVGFSFLAILTALRMGELPRFLMLVLVSALLYAGSLLAFRRSATGLLGSWLRSASGALFLFGCLGATAIPWLQWVTSPAQGYALLAVGIAVNLYFALRGEGQFFASFHTLISLAALAIAPAEGPAMAVAVIVTGACSAPAYRRPWGLHLLLTVSSFFAFLVAWMLRQPELNASVEALALAGLLAALAPGFGAPYYNPQKGSDRFGFAARGAMWIYLSAAAFAFSQHLPWIAWVVLAIGGIAYLLSRIAPDSTPGWLPRLDGIAAIVLAVLASTGFLRLEFDIFLAAGIAYVVNVLISLDRKGYDVVRRFSGLVQTLLGAGIIVAAVSPDLLTEYRTTSQIQVGVVVLVLAAATIVQLRIRRDRRQWVRLTLEALFPAFLGALYFVGFDVPAIPQWITYGGVLILVPAVVGTLADRREPSVASRIGLIIVVAVAHVTSLVAADRIADWGLAARGAHGLALLALATVAALATTRRIDGRRAVPLWPGLFLLVVDLAVLALSLTAAVDRGWTMVLWLAISAALYPVANSLPNTSVADGRLYVRMAAVALAAVAGVVTAVLAADRVSPRLLRYGSQALVVGTLILWSPKSQDQKAGPVSHRPTTLVLLGSLAFACVYVILEVDRDFTAIALALLSLIALLIGRKGPEFMRPLTVHSTLSYFLALIAFPLYSGPIFHETLGLFSRAWWSGLGGALAALLYITGFYVLADLEHLDIHDERLAMRSFRLALAVHRNLAVFTPFFVAAGLYFLWSFSGPALTALYIVESFAIFVLAIALKEKVFRPFAYGLIGFCLVRLIFFDMAEADTLERAVVFIIAGAVLLGMNALYNRFAVSEEEGGRS